VGSFPPCLDAAGPRVQANLNGGEENLGDTLDDLDIPAYDILCGQRPDSTGPRTWGDCDAHDAVPESALRPL
jgi:hypothetical protein